MRGLRRAALVAGVLVSALVVTGTADATAHYGNATCHSGIVKAGTYRSLTIAGSCTLTSTGTVTVRHDLVVKRHAFFNADTPGVLNVWGDTWIKNDAVAAIGCTDDCKVSPDDHIGGDLTAIGAWATIVHGLTIGGDVSFLGGGGSENCAITPILGILPYYSTVHDSTIGGDFTARRLHTCWFGLIRTHVAGDARIIGNRFGDPDANEDVTNVIGGNLACFNNVPKAQVGDSMGAPNVVGGHKRGECASL